MINNLDNSHSFDSNTAQINSDEAASQVLQSAKQFLDIIARTHKFSVIFSDFPKVSFLKLNNFLTYTELILIYCFIF